MKSTGNLLEKLQSIKALMKSNLPLINKEIDNMIAKKTKDYRAIEYVLDMLLDYRYMEIGEREFDKLVTYYRTVDEDGADYYQKAYKEI